MQNVVGAAIVGGQVGIGQFIGNQGRAQLAKTANVAFDAVGRVTQQFIEQAAKIAIDATEHHARNYVKQFAGIDLIINEIATSVDGRTIRLTVVLSPDDKINDKTFESRGSTSADARSKCEGCITTVVKWNYRDLVERH